jgi:hypothetical protein
MSTYFLYSRGAVDKIKNQKFGLLIGLISRDLKPIKKYQTQNCRMGGNCNLG